MTQKRLYTGRSTRTIQRLKKQRREADIDSSSGDDTDVSCQCQNAAAPVALQMKGSPLKLRWVHLHRLAHQVDGQASPSVEHLIAVPPAPVSLCISGASHESSSSVHEPDKDVEEEEFNSPQRDSDDFVPDVDNGSGDEDMDFEEQEFSSPQRDPSDPHLDLDPGGDSEDEDGTRSSASSDSESDSSNATLDTEALLNRESLKRNLPLETNYTAGDALLLDLASSIRHRWTFESLLTQFRTKNCLFGSKFFPTSKGELWSVIGRGDSGVVSHAYCKADNCGAYLGKLEKLEDTVTCKCNFTASKKNVGRFITFDPKKQIQLFLNTPGIAEHLKYPETRKKRGIDTVDDVYDGAQYKKLKVEGQPLASDYQYSYVLNTDGCKLSKKGKNTVWPLFLRLLELPAALRQKFTFLAAVYVDTKDPNMNAFLKPFRKQANKLLNDGVNWKPDGVHTVTSKFIPACQCIDAAARNKMLNMNKYNSHYGCTGCTHYGVYEGGSMRYPIFPHPEITHPIEIRTHDGMLEDMIKATEMKMNMTAAEKKHFNVRGHKGSTELMLIDHFDMHVGNAFCDLYLVDEGVCPDHTEKLLKDVKRIPESMGLEKLMSEVDMRLLKIRTPSIISRKPVSISKRASWKGSEWRHWLLYYFPCLKGLIDDSYLKHLGQLSSGVFILSQDGSTPAELKNAGRLLNWYVEKYARLVGVKSMTLVTYS